jgi:hypothetical protein
MVLKRVWKASWLSATAADRRGSEMVLPVRATHVTPANARATRRASTPGESPPATVCEPAATRVEKSAASQPRAKRAQRVVMASPRSPLCLPA